MNIYVKKIYPIKGNDDFFKFVVIKDGSVCRGDQCNEKDVELHFDNFEDAERILKAYERVEKCNEEFAKINRIKDYLETQKGNLKFTLERIEIQNKLGYNRYSKSGGQWSEPQYTQLDARELESKIELAEKWLSINDI